MAEKHFFIIVMSRDIDSKLLSLQNNPLKLNQGKKKRKKMCPWLTTC